MMLNEGAGKPLIGGYCAEVKSDVPLSSAWLVNDKLGEQEQRELVRVFEGALEMIRTHRTQATVLLSKYAKIPTQIHSEIGLNSWELTTNPSARQNLLKFAQLLANYHAIKAIPEDEKWIWTR